jgi:hypothetical protein
MVARNLKLTQNSELATQLGHCLRHTIHGRREGREFAEQSVLRLGKLLFCLHCLRVSLSPLPRHCAYKLTFS